MSLATASKDLDKIAKKIHVSQKVCMRRGIASCVDARPCACPVLVTVRVSTP